MQKKLIIQCNVVSLGCSFVKRFFHFTQQHAPKVVSSVAAVGLGSYYQNTMFTASSQKQWGREIVTSTLAKLSGKRTRPKTDEICRKVSARFPIGQYQRTSNLTTLSLKNWWQMESSDWKHVSLQSERHLRSRYLHWK